MPKPDGGVRKLGVPTVLDRFVQQAIAQVLIPIYEPKFSDNSFGFRPNRCCEMAIIKALEYMNDGFQWVVDIDLEKFFDTVNHDKLISLVMKDVKSGEIVSLIRKFLVSGIMVDKEYKESIIGTPQGGNLSPLLSNIILNELDKELEARGLRFTRYADDCIILVGSSKSALIELWLT
ncbi:reverse transcriptase domain-containing protein [Catenibacterium sp.]|uniref:reverse transcriptase domain-containing protein n=1 Tax=Catenibacterium sp. TaxID=2049022 RepID=UPI0039969E41